MNAIQSFFSILVLFIGMTGFAQEKFDEVSVQVFQNELISEFADSLKSPLQKADLKTFRGLDFFPVSADYFVNAAFVRTKKEKPFQMKTTTDRRPVYVKYGEVHFELAGKQVQLNVYQNVDMAKKGYKKLFLPFTDLTSGNESYGGGRYIDLEIPKAETAAIDFNKAYNPYCAYNHSYSCPIVPSENDLKVEVRAGVKKFHD